MSTYEEKIIWHEITTRPLDDEEKEYYSENYDYIPKYILECPMPDDGDEILVVTKRGYVDTDICSVEIGSVYYLESFGDWDEIEAWAEMPKYKKEEPYAK